ncbi:MAG: GNAT family N-acetyltransferase [Butyrivibrio sp.]|nr:GNAT family N-acetyltransferase [Butyrivibrio sp.]
MSIRLRILESKDCDGMMEWMHDKEAIHSFQKNMEDKTRADVLNFIASAKPIPLDGEDMHYAVVDETDEYLGTISLKSINLKDGNAEYAISTRKKVWGKGVAQEATKELLNIAFKELHLEKVYLNVLADNVRAIRLYEKCGFHLEGEFRNHLYLEGQYKNLKWYAILRKEYMKNN